MTVLGPAREQSARARGSEVCPSIRCNGTDDEGSSGRDSSGDHSRAEKVGVKYNYNLRGEGMIG